jgi:predicted Zn finger-like uncharacterized protein
MKFNCDQCQTRYSIGDEKVRGKVLKIRCKTCGNIIVVREEAKVVQAEASALAERQVAQAASGGAGAGPALPPAMPASTAPPATDWYMAIKGQQHGPSKKDAVVQLLREGKITPRTYMWHEALPSWTRLKDLPDFSHLFDATGQLKKIAPPVPTVSEDMPKSAHAGAKVVSLEAERERRSGGAVVETSVPWQAPVAPVAAAAPGLVTHDPFGAVASATGATETRDSTRVFIVNAGLHNRSKKNRLYAAVAVVSVLGFVGLCAFDYKYDVLGLKQVVVAMAERTGISAPPERKTMDDEDRDLAAVCAFKPDDPACVALAERTIEKTKARVSRAGGGPKTGNVFGDSGAVDLGSQVGAPKGAGAIDNSAPEIALAGGLSDEERKKLFAVGGGMSPSGPKAPSGPTGIDTPTVAGAQIDAENVSKVVKAGQSAVKDCVEKAMKNGEDVPGKVKMTLSIRPNGVVDKSRVDNAVVQASPLGGCLSSATKKWKFAPFAGNETLDVGLPLVLR